MTKGLALSGGGARGSFQVGALDCLYTVFGYRPDVIAGTSVGSVNALALAQASTDDEKLAQLRTLLTVWRSMTGPGSFYTNRQWFADITRSESLSLGGGLSLRIEDVVVQILFNNLIGTAEHSTSLAVLDPLRDLMRTPAMLNTAKLAAGVPLRMVCVSLESGRIRYTTGRGLFLEDDNFTPVASALPRVPVIAAQHDAYTQAAIAIRNIMAAIEDQRDHGPHDTKWHNIAELRRDLERATWRAETAFDALAAANAATGWAVQAPVDVVIGSLASSAIPGIFGPYEIGFETYVDGGVREIVPVRAAIQMGATEVVAVVCSTQNLPKAGYAGTQNFIANLIGSLSGISLKEVVEDDLAGRGIGTVPVTTIIPSFDVHDTAVVEPALIDISMDYGFMRAGDVMSALDAAARKDARLLSDAIAWLRMDTHLRSQLWNRPSASGAHQELLVLRLRKWLIRKLTEARIASQVPLPPLAMLWFQTWERGATLAPNIANPWQSFVTVSQTTRGVAAYAYVPDGWAYEEKGDLSGIYLIRSGAAFRGTLDTVAAALGVQPGGVDAALTVPEATTRHLPTVPVAGTVLAEAAPAGQPVQTPGQWYVNGTRRYLLNPGAAVALGAVQPGLVPSGGLAQIPDGGSPYWVGGLVIANSLPEVIHTWDPTPQVEGTRTSTAVCLWNRSTRNVTVTRTQISTQADTAASRIFTVRPPQPFTVAVGQLMVVGVDFDARTPGPLTGIVAVDCDDPTAPSLRLPLSGSVRPLGRHAALQLSATTIDLGSTLVGSTVGQEVFITNTGTRDAWLDAVAVVDAQPVGQFAVSTYGLLNPLPPGQQTRCYVSYTPTARGPAIATLAIDLSSDTDAGAVRFHQRYPVPISARAGMPTIFLSAGPARRRPIPRPLPIPELTTLDFGTGPSGVLVNRSFWLRNVGDTPLTVSGIVVYQQGSFGVTNAAIFPATLQPGAELEVPGNYLPGQQGTSASGEFHVFSNDPLRPEAVLFLVGRAAGPHLKVPPELLDLGDVVAPASAILTFSSDGTGPVTVKRLRLNSGTHFSVSANPTLPAVLATGGHLTITVTVLATTPGVYQDQLHLVHDGLPSGESSVVVRAAVH